MKKRILSFLLALCMCLTLVPVTVLADDDVQQINDAAVQAITPGSDVSVLSVVDPGNDYYRTYEFYVDGEKIDTQIVKNGDTLYEPPVTAPAGKTFTGWDNKDVHFGTISGITATETITVNAVFDEGYHVYFKDPDGRIIATKTGKTNDTISVADVNFPVGSDEAITGWYTDAGQKVESVTINGADITLYAKVEQGYWLTFESNGGSYVAPAFYANGTPAAAPDEPTKSGYTFAGWYTDEDLKTPASFGSITARTTLYAKWTEKGNTSYTVIHWLENADDDGYSYQASETKTGTTGGETNAQAKSYQGFTAQTITQETIKGDGSTIVSVKYKRNVYEVKFYTKNSLRDDWKEDTSKRITAKYGANIRKQWPGGSWYVGPNSSTAQANLPVMPLGGKNFYGAVAEGNKPTYYYVEVLPGDTGIYDGGRYYALDHTDYWPSTWTVTKEDQYAITGFTFDHGTSIGSSLNKAKFYYTRNSYNIVFVSNGSDEHIVSKKFEQSIADVNYTPKPLTGEKSDYVFVGWYASKECTGDAYDFTGKTMPAQSITLYAKWVAPTYTVTVYDQDGKEIGKTTVSKGETVIGKMPAVTVGEDETFLGWVQDSPNGNPFTLTTEIHRDYSLYAKVGSTAKYTVTYDGNGGTGSVTDSEAYGKGAFATVKANAFNKDNMVFLSWNTKTDGTGKTYYPNSTVKITGDVTLYAQWGDKASTVQLTYKANGGKEADIVRNNLLNNEQVTLLGADTFTRTGYRFTGWNTQADGEGTSFAADASARVDDNLGSGNVLYAQWTPNTDTTYKVEFYYQNDDGSYPSIASKTDPRTGTTDTTVSVTDTDKADKENGKYTFDANNANNILSGHVAADGSLVLKLYFKLNQADVTVNYYWNETTDKVATSKTLPAQTVGSVITTEKPITIEGYTALPNQTCNLTVGVDASNNVINFYYYKNVELTANSKTETYDGTEKSVSGFTGAPADADFSAITVGAKGTEVGTYPANFTEGTKGTVDANKKYIVTEANNGQLTITADATAIVVKIKGNTLTKTYDGNEYTVEGYDVVSISDTRYTATDFSFTGTAEAKGTNVKTDGYSMGLTAAQFTNTSENFSNVKFEVTDGKLTINPRKVTLTSESGEKEYDGTPLTKPNVTVGGDGFVTGEVTDIKATGSVTYVSDGEVTNTITYTTGEKFNADNYNISKSEGKLKITDRTAKYEITVKANRGEKTYDGTPLDVSGFENLEFTVNGQKYTVSGLTASKTGTNVSDSGAVVVEGTAVVKDANGIDVTKQFKVNTEDGKLTIEKRTVTLTSGSASKQYDGTPLTKDEVKVTGDGFADGEGATYDVTGTITNVADNNPNNNTFTYTLNKGTTAGNYVIEIMYGTLEITPVAAEVTVEIKGHTTDAIYDATEKTAEGYEVISISNELYTAKDFALTGKDKVTGIAAGEYDMGLAFENISKNFSKVTFVVEDGKLTIAKRDVTVTGESATKVYNGQTQEINGYTVDNLVTGHEMTGVTYSAKGKDPGKYDGSFTGSQIVIKDADGNYVTANYNVKTVIGALTITQPSRPTRPSTPTKDVTSVKTADGSQMTLWMSMMLASAAGIVFLGKKRKEEQ